MKKYLLLFVIMASFSMLFLTGCGNDEEASEEQITLTYMNWANGAEGDESNVDMKMIEAYEEANPNINIEVIYPPEGDWNENLATLASTGELPDVFMISSVPIALQNGWLYDVSELVANDEEFQALPEVVKENLYYGEGIYCLPYGVFMRGYYVNNDIFEQYNLEPLEWGYTLEEFINACLVTTDSTQGTIALEHVDMFREWYPAVVDPTLGNYAMGEDGNLHLDSQAVVEMTETMQQLSSAGAVYNLLPEDQQLTYGKDGWEAWSTGNMTFMYDGTWGAAYHTQEVPFDATFIGLPNGNVEFIGDFLGISATTEHPEEAYEFAKYMSFGNEGFAKRLEISSQEGMAPITTMPLCSDPELIEQYWDQFILPELRPIWEDAISGSGENVIFELGKTVPGFAEVRGSAKIGVPIGDNPDPTVTDFWIAVAKGEINYTDYAQQLNTWSNQYLDDADASVQEGLESTESSE